MMKKTFLLVVCLSVCWFAQAQDSPKIGELLRINGPSGQFYNHVSFPQLNILVKRGKIASYKPVCRNEVVIDEVVTKNNGETYVVLKKKDGSKFFDFISKVEANYTKAVDSGNYL
ncbi:hypothetical protein N7U66_14040 [Lacinutrix neustonica]|uniref:Uncharacterized protein n=1 Tax=Lacinutrix neustonica TaxID=2980107 RepID=A0A9E8SG03_9FLAO|nr:hypothetical protein [Lacinutrix neustonica]WAC01235.1 hypothetical protein N7U66_14040 [Lacinutrix neustonica]